MYTKHTKRILDITLAAALAIITLPILALVAIILKLDSKGPVLFRQNRTGIGGKDFQLFKLRSMTHNNNVHDVTVENQITRVGGVIRKLSLDEIPQLINILKGEMSFIGPRPWLPDYHTHMSDEQRKRSSVLPGITGLAQVKGRNSISIHEKINYDLQYVQNISLLQDIKIIFLTVKTIFDKGSEYIEKSGIHQEIEMLMQENQTGQEA